MASQDSAISHMIRTNVESLEEMNIRTFTKWINSKLGGKEPVVKNLIKDLQDGHVLLSLLEVLLKVKLRHEKGKLRFHKLNNVNLVLKTLEERGLKLHGISNTAIVDGNKISILGLMWMIILHFQVQGIIFEDESNDSESKGSGEPRKKSVTSQADVERILLKWAQDVLKGFSDVVPIDDIVKSWQNGLAFVLLLCVHRPSAVDSDKAYKMEVLERLEYAFNVAEKEFEVHRLLDPTDVEQGNVDKKAMLMYLSSLYEALRNIEPAVVQTETREEIVRTTTSAEVESEPGSSSLRTGDETVEITTVSTNKIVLQYKTVYYTVLYTIKGLEERMKKIQNEEPSQENAKALREIHKEMQELQVKIKELNDTNKEMAKAEGVDRQEFSDIQTELGELSQRWSTLIKHNNEENKRQPGIIKEVRTTRTVHTARLTIGDEVIEITTVSSNEIVIKYKIVYYQIITIIKLIESNMKIIREEEPSQKTARLLDENQQRLEQLQPKITEMNELMSQMKGAEGVDPEELSQLQVELADFDSRLSTVTEQINDEEKRQPAPATEIVYSTTTEVVESAPPSTTSTSLRIGAEVVDITTVSTNEIVLQYKTVYYTVLYTIKGMEERMEKIRSEEPSQENAKALREIQKEMQELQVKIKELNETNKEMAKAEGVDRQEFSDIQTELGELSQRWSTLIKHNNEENKRQPRIITHKTTTTIVPRHKARLTIGDEVIEITCVSSNEIVIKYKIVYYQIITIIKLVESNMKIIHEQPPSQETARLLDENRQRMEQLQPKITEMNELMSQMQNAEGVDPEELSQLQAELKDFDSRRGALNEDIGKEEKRQPKLTSRTVYTTTTTIVDGGRRDQLRDGDKVIEFKTVSTNQIVLRYKILYYEITTIIILIESNAKAIRERKPSQETARLLEENKQRMEQLQPKITELRELMSQMKNADGVDPQEYSQLRSELSDFNSKMESLNEEISKEEKRQPPLEGEIISKTTTTTVQSAPLAASRHATVKYGDQVFEITTVSTNEIVIRYKILYYEIITLIKNMEGTVAQIKDAPPSNTTAVMLKQNKDQMDEIQAKIRELKQLEKDMDGAEGVDANELEELQAELDSLDSRWTKLTDDIDSEDKRISSALGRREKQKASLDEWRKKCEKIGDWMDSIEDNVEVLENTKPSNDIMIATQQMNGCNALQERIKSDEVPTSIMAYGEEIAMEPSISPDQKSKVKLQMAEIKKEIGKLSDRAGAAKHKYKRAIDKLQAQRQQKLASLKGTFKHLDKQIDILKNKDDQIGKVEGDPAAVRAKETLIELLVSDIQVFQPRFDDFRQASWEVLEDPQTDQSDRVSLQENVRSLEERWGSLIRSVYSRSEAAKNLISKLPQGGVLEELIIVENRRHDYNLDWKAHRDLFGVEGHDEGAVDDQFYRERLITRWKRECREVDEALLDVEHESSELGDILDDPSKSAMKKAKMEVIRSGLKKVEKEYNDLPQYANLLLSDPKLTDDDRKKIQDDLDSYKIRHDDLLKLVREREEALKEQEPSKPTVVVTESFEKKVPEKKVPEKKEVSADIIVPEFAVAEESAPDSLFTEPETYTSSNAADIKKWWDDDGKVANWIEKVDNQVKRVRSEPASWDLVTTRKQHANVERITQEIGLYETNVTLLENKANALVDDPVTRSEDGQKIKDEMKTVKLNWDNLKENAFNVERNLYERVNKLQEYLSWTQKSEALSGWLEDTERSLDSCATPSSDPAEREKQTLFLEKFLKERGQNQESVDDVLSHGNLVVNKNLVPEQHLDKIKQDLKDYREKWNDLVKKAENVQERLSTGKKDLQKLESNQKEYVVIITWIIKSERRLKELQGDTSGDDEALKKRRIVILEIIEEITVYRIRLRRLIEDNENLANKDTLPPEDRDKLVKDTKDLEKRLDDLDDNTKKEESSINKQLGSNTAKLDDWQSKADELDELIVATKTEIKSFKVPPIDENDKEKQKKYLEDFGKRKQEGDDRVKDVVSTGRQLVNEGVIPSEKRQKFEVDLESIPGNWDDVVKTADELKANVEKVDRSSDDYDNWCNDVAETKKIIEKQQQEVEASSTPTSDPEERKKHIVTITKIIADKPKLEERINETTFRGKELRDNPYLTPEQKEHINRESQDVQVNWDDFANKLDDAKTSVESGEQDLQELAQYRVDYDVIVTWITTNEKRLQDVKDDDDKDRESIEKRRVILKVITNEFPEYRTKLREVIAKGKHLSETPRIPPDEREEIKKQCDDLDKKLNTLENDVNDENKKVDDNLKNLDKYESWQQKSDDLKEKLNETKENLDKFDTPTSEVGEREKQKRFLNDFNKKKPAQEKAMNDIVRDGQKLIDEDIVPTDKREAVEFDLQSLPETWNGIVAKADENKKTVDSSFQDAVQLNKWRNDYNVVLLWIEKAEEKRNQRDEEDTGDLDKLKKQRRKLETDVKDIVKYEPKIAPLLSRAETVSRSTFITPEDAKSVEEDGKALKERFDELKVGETERKQKLDNKIQWLTDYKQYRTDADALSVMLDDNQNKLESCEKPTSNKAERDKQASFLNQFVKNQDQNNKAVDKVVEQGNRLANAPGIPEDKGDEIKEETKTTEETWKIMVLKVEELQKIVTSGIQNITELSDWRKEYTTVIKWIETNEKKLTALGEPGEQHRDLSNKCTTLDEMVNLLPTYETRVVLLLEKGDQLAKEPSIDEADRKQTEDDTKALRERWDRLKADEHDKKKRFDDQKRFVEDYHDWKDNVGELKPFLDNTKKEMDACELPTSDHSVREKQAHFIKTFSEDKDKNQARVDNVTDGGESLLKQNPVAQKDERDIRDTIDNTRNSWNTILQRFDGVEQSVTSGTQDIIQLEEWRKDRNELNKSLDNARQQVRTLKKPSKDPVKMKKQKNDFEVIFSQMADSADKVSDLSQKAEYFTKTSSISPKDKDRVSQDMEQLNNTWKNYKNEEDAAIASFDAQPVEPVTEVVKVEKAEDLVVQGAFEGDLESPEAVDYGEWKDSVAELEGILDKEDGKFDPKSEIEKEYANLEKLAQETKDSGSTVDDVCKPKLAKILSDGNALVNGKQLDETEEKEVSEKMMELKDRTERVDTAVTITRMKVRDAALKHFNDALNECSVNANNMQETAKTLQPANDLTGVRVQIASMKALDKRLAADGEKVEDIEKKVDKMEDAGVLPRDGFAGTLNDRCHEVKKEQQIVNTSLEEARPKLHRALINQLNRTQKTVNKWLKLGEKKERNIDVANVKDLEKARQECLKLKQAKAEFDKGDPLYITLTEVHKEAVDDGILVDKKAAEFEKQIEGLTTRHDELKKRLGDKEIELLDYARQSTEAVLNSAEEKLEEQKTWLEPEDPADNFTDAKVQQDKMKDHESAIKERTKDVIVQLGPVERIATGEILPLPEATALQIRIADVKTKFNADIPAAKDKSQKMKEGYSELLKKEMEKRKAWIDEHVDRTPETDDDFKNFKDFNEFKVKYDQNKEFAKELDDNNIQVLIEEADKIDGIEPELKDELKDLNERWDKIHDAAKDRTESYEDLMSKWVAFREQQLTLLNWVDEKDAEATGGKEQVNLADEDEIAEYIKKLKDVKEEAEVQGASQEKKLKEASEDLIQVLGEDSPSAAEVNKQVEEVDSVRQSLVNDIGTRIEKIESSEQKTKDLYSNMDDVTTWMDGTEKLIDTYENQEKQAAGDDGSRDLAVPHVGEVPEEMVHVVEEILAKRKEIPERELQLNDAVTCVGELDDQLDETTVENAREKVNDMKDRWGVVTQRLDDFCNRDIPEIEIAEIKAENLETELLDETDAKSVVPLSEWEEKVRKVNLLLKYVERLVGVKTDSKMDYPSIRILASNTKEATKTITKYCKPRAEKISALGYNIVDADPHNIDQGEKITTTIDALNKRIEHSETGAAVLKLKVHDTALDYFNNRLNHCEIALESEEENANKLTSAKPDLETTQEQMVLLKEGRKEFDKNQEDYKNVVDELKDKKVAEFLSKDGFQGTVGDKSDSIKARREAVDKKLKESKTRIYRNLITHLTEMKKNVAKWLTSCEKTEKAITVDPTPTRDPVAEYRKLKALREVMDASEPKYDATIVLNQQLINDRVLEGRKAANSEKELQSFATRYAAIGKHYHDKRTALYTVLLNLTQITMVELEDNIKEADTKVEQTRLAERFPQVKQDFQNAKDVKNEVDEVCEKSKDSLKDVHAIVSLDVFNDNDRTKVDDRRNELKNKNAQLEEKSDEKFNRFAKQYNEIIENEVKNRKMWLDENESWMNINDNDVDELAGFAKKLEEQKIFQEELERRKMVGLIDEARDNEELSPETRFLIYDLDDKWNNLNNWSVERLDKLNRINVDWKNLREQERGLLDVIDDNDARLKLMSSPVDLSDKLETENQRNELKDLQSDAQVLGLNVVKIHKSSNDLIKLVGPDSSAGKRMEKEFEDISTCHADLCNDALARLKKLDASERKAEALYDHMDDINAAMDESENILKSLDDEIKQKQAEEKKDKGKEDEINENAEEAREDEDTEKKDKSPELNKFVDQISLRRGERPEEVARVKRAKELETSLEEYISDEAKDMLQKQLEDFDNRWEDVTSKVDEALKDNAIEEPEPIKAFHVQEVESALPEDQTVEFSVWKDDAAEIDESMLKSQTALQAYDVDIKDYSSLKKTETETQNIIDRMNTEFKPKLITLRSSGEKIPDQDPAVTSDQVDDIVNSSQKNLEGVQSALQLRKFRLHDSAVQHMNERILECEANVGEEEVKLQLLTPPGKDLDTVLDQLFALQESEETFRTNQVKFEEVQVDLNELKQSKILTSPEFREQFQDECKDIAIDRGQVLKQTRDYKNKLYRAIVNIFDMRKKEIAKWLKNCEKKENEIPNEVEDLDRALIAVKKIQETEDVLNQGERNYHETAELAKTISENEILADKKAKDAENDMKNSSLRYNQLLEDVQNKKNKLYKTIHELLTQQLDETEDEIKKAEDVVQVESQPEDPTATHEELAKLQVVVSSSDDLKEQSGKLFDKAHTLLSADIFPQEDKRELRKKVIDLDKRAYDLPEAAKDKHEQVYTAYLSNLTKLIQLRTEWITANEPRMEQVDTTDASDISDMQSKLNEHEEFESDLKKNNIRSVSEQIRDTSELDPDIPLSDLLSLEKRWEVLNAWAHKRNIFLLSTLDKWKAFRQEEMTMIAWIDAKDTNLQELDVPINLTDENAVQERLHTLRDLQTDVNLHLPNLDHFKNSGKSLLEDLKPESEGAEQVKKQIEDFENCWKKLEKDIVEKIEKMEKSNRTIKAIHNYMDVVNNWLDDTDGKLNKVDSSKDELRNVTPLSALPSAEHSVDGVSKEEPGDETKEDEQPADKTWDAFEDIEASKTLSEDEKEQVQDTIEQMTIDIKANSRAKDLNKARIERVRLLVDDIHDDVDEDGVNAMEEKLCEITERCEHIDKRLEQILQEEKLQEVQSEPELVTIQTTSDIQTLPIEEQRPTGSTSQDATTDTVVLQEPAIEPYSGKVTLNLEEWRTVATNLREFLHKMQMNIRDIHSENYEEMRECEVDTKLCIDAMEIFGKPCLNDLILSGNGMLDSPEYTEEEKNEIGETLELLTVGAQFVTFNASDQRLRLYRGLISYQSDQKKLVQRWLNSCSRESRDVHEDVAGLEASDAEYKKLLHLKNTLSSGEATFLHYKELSKRMIQNNVIPEKKIAETEKDIASFTTTYDNLRAETERKDKILYTTVVKSISLPLESIQLSVTEGENWVAPEELSNEYDQAKEQLNKMKLSVFVIETLHTRSAKVLKETEALVYEHVFLTPEDKQKIIDRVHSLTPRAEALPAAILNKYKRMNREYLVLIESEVERRDAWITKNEAKMNAPPAGDVQDLEGFLQLKDAHDDFLKELKRTEMSEFAKDAESLGDLKKATMTKIYELQTRWSELLAWGTNRTVYLNTVIANWQEYRQHEVTATDFMDANEGALQEISKGVHDGSDKVTKEKADQLENMRAEARENSLEIWEVQRQSSVLIKSIGKDAPVTKIIEQQTADLAERNEKLSQGILAGINGLEANQYKAKKLQEHINSVSDWTTSTTVFVDEFNEIAPQLLQTDGTPEKDKKDDATTDETGTKDGEADAVDEGDEEKAKQEREEKINEANDVIHRIAIRRVDIGEYQATVDRINELQAELAGEPGQQSDLDMQVEQLNTNWANFNTAVDKVAWTKIPGVNSLQAVTYILHDMQITKKSDESPASVETIDQWKEKVAELESCVGEVEEKFKPEKDIPHDFAEIKAVSTNIQECRKEIDEEVLPKLEVIRLVGVKLCSPSQEADEEPQPVGEEIKREVSTTVLSLHEKIEHLQTIIQLQTLRLDDVIHDYFYERVRSDQSLLAQELTDSKRLFPVGEDVETMIVQLEIMKESENTFNANEERLKETQKQFTELNELVLIKDQELVTFLNESNKNLDIQRRTTGKLYLDIEQKLHRNLLSKFNTNKTKLNKWLKKMEKREKTVDSGVEGVEKAFAECIKLQTISEDLPVGEEVSQQVIQLLVQINVEVIWSEAELDAARSEVNSLTDRRDALKKSIEKKRNALQTKVQEGVDETLGVTEKSISDAEAWDKPSNLSKEMEQATTQMQQSMEKVTNVNNMYTQTMQSLKRPQEIAQSGVLPSEISVTIEARCHDLNKRVGRLPSIVLKIHKSLFEAFMELLHDVVSEREEWISQNETNVMASFVSITSLEDLKNKIQENREFIVEIKKYDMAPVIVEIDKMSVPDFKLKASSKDLQSRLLVIEKSAEEKQLVLLSILSQWEAMRALLRELLNWIDVKDLKLRELKEQVNLADEDEVHGELKELKLMQTQMDDEYPEVVKLKKMGEDLVKILGDESGASAVVNEQVKDFIDCWNNLGDDIREKIRKLESSERQLSTMHRYMDNTQDWMENVTEILDQYAANERRLQGLPVEEKPKDSEVDTKESQEVTDVSEDKPKVPEEKAEPKIAELDEDEKEKLRDKNKDLMKEFVVKRQNGATCQAFVDWAGELGEQASEDLDDESKEILKIRIEKFVSAWDVFTNNLEDFSQNNVEEIQFIEFQLAEQRSEDLPETVTFEEWKADISNMEVWFTTMDEKCSQVNLKRDSDSLKKGEQDTKSILTDFNSEGKPRFNRIVVLGRRLIDSKSHTPEEEQEITITITKFTKRMIEVERVVELHRIRTLETIVDYCQERLDSCQSSVERDEVNMNQLAPSGSTPEAVHEQIVLLKFCEDEIPQHEGEFVEIKTYIRETRHPGLISYETQSELERSCRQVEKRRNDVDKQLKESHSRLYRTIVNFFEQRKKVTLKWVGSCERKEKQVKPDVKELKDSKNEYVKVKEVRTEFDEGRPNFVSFIEVHKLILADDVLDSKKSTQVEKDVNSISGRVEQVDKILHEQETTLYTTVLTTLTVLLDSIESTLSDARARIKPDEVSSTYFKMAKKQMDTTNAMARDIQAIHLAANKQLEQGEDVKRAKLLGPEDADTLELRLSDLTKKSADLQEAAQEKELRMRVEYVMTFKTELQRCSQWIIFLESRVEKTSAEAEDYFGYQQLREDHIHFEEDLKVYDLNMLIKEVDKIDELEPTVKQELAALEKRWKKLLNWSEEKGLRLSKIVSLWSKYRQEEIAILNWIDEKGEQLKVADEVNLANEEAVKNQLEIFKDLVSEREEYVKRSVDVEDMGHELKRIVGDNTKAGQLIQKQMVDLDQVFNELIKQMVQKHVQLESAQRRLQSMSEEMNLVNTWCNESEVLLNEYDVMEQKLQDLNVGYKSGESPESEEDQGKTETKKEKRARIKEEKAELREDMIQQIEKLSIQFEKLPSSETKVKRVNTMGDELKAEVDDAEKQALGGKLQPFNDRFNAVSQRLVDMANKDLPESSGCWFARFIRRKLFRASIN